MVLPLTRDLINRSITTEKLMEQVKEGVLRTYPTLNSDDISMQKLDNDGQFVLIVTCGDTWGTNFRINVLNRARQMREQQMAYRFNPQNPANDYAFVATTSCARSMKLQSQYTTNPTDAVIDLIQRGYQNKPAFARLAQGLPIHSSHYQKNYSNQEPLSQANFNDVNDSAASAYNYNENQSVNNSKREPSFLEDLGHILFGKN